ncbi:MAG TPA: signal peptidase I, partial [Planctomycetota bacterium]|nr:signal peptidase I [Planctomycetota bacterium]
MAPKKPKTKSGHPWRENIEAITISIVIIVLFKYFVLEAYKIPTGSMQPTLMGWDNGKGGGVFDRVLVDKLSFEFRDPERFEVLVFKYPLDKSKNFIKRVWGMPGEDLEVRDGDVFAKKPGEEWQIPRRSDALLDSMLRKLDSSGEWHVPAKGWQMKGDTLIAESGGQALFPRTHSAVKDRYGDGYPGKLGPLVERGKQNQGINTVGDLRIRLGLCAKPECREVEIEFHEGDRRYRIQIPGPKAVTGTKVHLWSALGSGDEDVAPIDSEAAFALEAGDCVDVEAQNIDDQIRLKIDGKVFLEVPIPPIRQIDLTDSGISLRTTGDGAEFRDIRVWRDIYYTSDQKYTRWSIPEKHYVMLGDNTQDSSDSRDWSLGRYRVHEGD